MHPATDMYPSENFSYSKHAFHPSLGDPQPSNNNFRTRMLPQSINYSLRYTNIHIPPLTISTPLSWCNVKLTKIMPRNLQHISEMSKHHNHASAYEAMPSLQILLFDVFSLSTSESTLSKETTIIMGTCSRWTTT